MIFRLLLLLVALSPLPLGSNREWAWSLCAAWVAVLALAWGVTALLKKAPPVFGFPHLRFSAVLFGVAAVWIGLQTAGFLPGDWHHPLWRMASECLKTTLHSAVSLDPEAGWTALMRLLTYVLVFGLALQYARDRENARSAFHWLAWAGFFYAIYGVVLYFGELDPILWQSDWSSPAHVSSTFVNRNSYATYAGLTLLCGIVCLTEKLALSTHYDFSGYWGAQRLLELLITRAWLPLVMLLTCGTALIASHSRGGFLSTLIASLVLLLLLNLRSQRGRAPVTLGLAGACIVAVVVFFVSGDPLLERLDHTSLNEHRAQIFEATLDAIGDNPWLGTGYGTYEEGFRMYKDETLSHRYDKAHNTYLENLFELGIPAAAALFVALALPAFRCLIGVFVRRRDSIYPAVGFAASLLVGIHALVDFSLQIPAVALTYALLMGVACGQAFPSERRRPRNAQNPGIRTTKSADQFLREPGR